MTKSDFSVQFRKLDLASGKVLIICDHDSRKGYLCKTFNEPFFVLKPTCHNLV